MDKQLKKVVDALREKGFQSVSLFYGKKAGKSCAIGIRLLEHDAEKIAEVLCDSKL